MDWLINAAKDKIDFGAEIELLAALKRLRDKGISLRDVLEDVLLSEDKSPLADYPELTEAERSEIERVLATLPQLLKKAFGYDVDEYPEELKFLGQRFDALGDQAVSYLWRLIDRDDQRPPARSDGLLFKLQGGASAGILIQVNPLLPEGVAASVLEPAPLSVVFQGALHAGSQLSTNVGKVSLKLGAAVSGSAELQYLFGHSRDTVVANALLKDVRHLKSPFDVADVYAGLHESRHLNAIQLTAEGDLTFDGKLGFANAARLGTGGRVEVGAEASVGFSLTESGRFSYLITKAVEAPYLLIRIRRTRIHGSQMTESLRIGIDMTKWAEKAYPEIRDHLSGVSELLDDVGEFLPGSGDLRAALEEALNGAIGDSNFKDEIKYALGFASNVRIDTIVKRELVPPIENAASLWLEDTSQSAKGVVSELFARVDLGTDVENDLQQALEDKLQHSLEKLRNKLSVKVATLVESLPAERLTEKLEGLGKQVQNQIDRADDKAAVLTGVVRDQLNLVQQRIARLEKPFTDASKAKVLYKYEALRREEGGRSLDIQIALDPSHDDAQRVLQDLLSGDLGSHLARKRSGAIVEISGTSQRYQAIVDSDHFNVVLFGLGFNGNTQAKIHSEISVDPQGNIQALTRQEWEKRYGRSVDSRRLTFANAREINASGSIRDITVNFGLAMEDKTLSSEEATVFLSPFAEFGLLPQVVLARAQTHTDGNLPTHIELGLSLTSEQLDRMTSKAEREEGIEVLRLGADVFEELAARQPPNSSFEYDLPEFLNELSQEVGSDLRSIGRAIEGWSSGVYSAALRVAERAGDDRALVMSRERLAAWLDARHTALVGKEAYCASMMDDEFALPGTESCDAVVAARPGMITFLSTIAGIRRRELEVEDADDETQVLRSLNDMQMQMNESLRNWHNYGADAAKWWLYGTREPRLFTMALFLLLARLSQSSGSTPPTLSAAIAVSNTNGQRERIPLT